MANNDGQERTEDASHKRLQDARKDGQVAKSQDLVGACVTMALVAALPSIVNTMGMGFLQGVRGCFMSLPTDASFSSLGRAVVMSLAPVGPSLLMLMGLVILVATIVTVAQTGFNVSVKPLTPSFQKIDPSQGIKRLLSARGAMEGVKAFFKFLVFGQIAYSALSSQWGILVNLSALTAPGGLAEVGDLIKGVATKIGMAWFALAAIDYFFQRKQMDKQLKMTKDEVKREHKDSDGSPEIKQARAQRRRKMMRQRTRDAVMMADVIVTNPTHYAVALKYDPEKSGAPIVVAKGVDVMAAKIREFAKEARVPIIPNPRLARALYAQCEVGDPIPRELFAAVAEVLAYVYKVIKKMRK